MRRTAVLIAAALAAALLLWSSPAPAGAGAGATTDVYVVHGLNLDGQTSQEDGGTAVTVCAGSASLIPDFQFGDVVGPVPLPSGQAVSVQVYAGADNDCETPAGALLIDQTVTPTGAAFSVVATSFGDQLSPELIGGEIDTACVDPGLGVVQAVHAANAPEVDIFSTDLDESLGTLAYDESLALELDAGTYGIEVYIVAEPPVLVLGPLDLPVTAETVTVGYAVGNQPAEGNTPVVLLTQVIPVEACEQPVPPTPPAPAPTPAAAAPTFTG